MSLTLSLDRLFTRANFRLANVAGILLWLGVSLFSAITGGTVGNRESYLTPYNDFEFVWTPFTAVLLFFVGGYQWLSQANEVVDALGFRFAFLALAHSVFILQTVKHHCMIAFILSLFVFAAATSVYLSLRAHRPSLATILACHKGSSDEPDRGTPLLDALLVHVPFSAWHAFALLTAVQAFFAAFPRADMEAVAVITVGLLAFAAWAYALQGPGVRGDAVASGVFVWYLFSLWRAQWGAGIHWCALSAGVAAAATVKGLVGEVEGVWRGEGAVRLGGDERAPSIV